MERMLHHPLLFPMNLSQFQQKVSVAGKPVVVDFWAAWCVPCRVTKPILESLAKEYYNQVEFLAINADEAQAILEQYQVVSIPTVLSLIDGQVIGRVTGAQNEADYRKMFGALVEGKDVRISLLPFDRLLRLGAGTLLIIAAIASDSWPLAGVGAILTFMGIYDRCLVWAALARMFKRKDKPV